MSQACAPVVSLAIVNSCNYSEGHAFVMSVSRRTMLCAAAASVAGACVFVWRRRRRTRNDIADGWVLVGNVSDLEDGPHGWRALQFNMAVQVSDSAEDESVSSCALKRQKDGMWVAFARSCPHAGIDLINADVEDLGDGPIVSCPAHSYLFDANSGACLWDATRGSPPTTPAMKTFEVREEPGTGEVWVRMKPRLKPCAPEDWDQEKANALQLAVVDRVLDRKFPG